MKKVVFLTVFCLFSSFVQVEPAIHFVKEGETPEGIARLYGCLVEDLQKVVPNDETRTLRSEKITAHSKIFIGEILKMPEKATGDLDLSFQKTKKDVPFEKIVSSNYKAKEIRDSKTRKSYFPGDIIPAGVNLVIESFTNLSGMVFTRVQSGEGFSQVALRITGNFKNYREILKIYNKNSNSYHPIKDRSIPNPGDIIYLERIYCLEKFKSFPEKDLDKLLFEKEKSFVAKIPTSNTIKTKPSESPKEISKKPPRRKIPPVLAFSPNFSIIRKVLTEEESLSKVKLPTRQSCKTVPREKDVVFEYRRPKWGPGSTSWNWTPEQIRAEIRRVFTFTDFQIMFAIANEESHYQPRLIGRINGGKDVGLFQINVLVHKQYNNPKEIEKLKDPGYNILVAEKIYKDRTKWDTNGFNAWSTFTKGKYLRSMKLARLWALSQQKEVARS